VTASRLGMALKKIFSKPVDSLVGIRLRNNRRSTLSRGPGMPHQQDTPLQVCRTADIFGGAKSVGSWRAFSRQRLLAEPSASGDFMPSMDWQTRTPAETELSC
jgi:hypothetical protein